MAGSPTVSSSSRSAPSSRRPCNTVRAPLGVGSRPSSGAHHQSNPPNRDPSADRRPKNSRLLPSGDHTGLSAVIKPSAMRVVLPPFVGTTNTAVPGARGPTPVSHGPVQYAMLCPSGEKRGQRPASAIKRALPPSAGITHTPPPPRFDRKAIRLPSGEMSGSRSSAGSLVNGTG